VGASPLALQSIERSAENALKEGEEANGMENGQMLTQASLLTAIPSEEQYSSDGVPDLY